MRRRLVDVVVCVCWRLQAWQKRYLVLRDSWTVDGDTSLELYACSDAGDSSGTSCKCHAVSLRHVMLVDEYRDSKSFPHAFIVFRSVLPNNFLYVRLRGVQSRNIMSA